jgi:hypothetical protein
MSLLISAAGWLLKQVGSRFVQRVTDRALDHVGVFSATCEHCRQSHNGVEIIEGATRTLSCFNCGHVGTVYLERLDNLVIHQVQHANIFIQNANIGIMNPTGFASGAQSPPAFALPVSLPPAHTRPSVEEICERYSPRFPPGCDMIVCDENRRVICTTYAQSWTRYAIHAGSSAHWYTHHRRDLKGVHVSFAAKDGEDVPLSFGPHNLQIRLSGISGSNERGDVTATMWVHRDSETLLHKATNLSDKNGITLGSAHFYLSWSGDGGRCAYVSGSMSLIKADDVVIDEWFAHYAP